MAVYEKWPTIKYATLTVGKDDVGYDVKFYGATSGKYLLWDESADTLTVAGDLGVTGDITITGDVGITGDYTFTGDLYLASGKKLDFNSGDVTITHSAGKLAVATTWSTAGTTGRPWGVTLTVSGTMGSYLNALKGYVDASSGGSQGLLSAVNCEVKTPNGSTIGCYYPLEIEFVSGGTSASCAGDVGSNEGFIYIGSSGDPNGDFDDHGFFMRVDGLTAGAGHVLSADSQTLKCAIGASLTARYLVLSTTENSIVMGADANPAGDFILYGTTTGCVVQFDVDSDTNGVWSFGASGGSKGIDVYLYGDTNGAYVQWDRSADTLHLEEAFMTIGGQGTGTTLTSTLPFALEVHALPTTALTAGLTGLSAGIRCRYEVGGDQTNQISIVAIDSRLRVKKDLADGAHAGLNATIEASETDTVMSGTSTTQRSAVHASLDFSDDVSITSGWLCGVTIDSSVHDDVSMALCTFVGCRIKTSTSKEIWEYAIYSDTGSSAVGIYMGVTTQAYEFVVSALGANARTARIATTCATPAMTDGYGAVENDFTVSGTATGIIAAASTWINYGASATIPSYCFCHTDGQWDGGATLTNAYVGWAKYQFLPQSNPAWCYLWELNFSGAHSELDAIFNCNDMTLCLGFTAGTPSGSATGSIPFCSNAGGGGMKYIYLYDDPT